MSLPVQPTLSTVALAKVEHSILNPKQIPNFKLQNSKKFQNPKSKIQIIVVRLKILIAYLLSFIHLYMCRSTPLAMTILGLFLGRRARRSNKVAN